MPAARTQNDPAVPAVPHAGRRAARVCSLLRGLRCALAAVLLGAPLFAQPVPVPQGPVPQGPPQGPVPQGPIDERQDPGAQDPGVQDPGVRGSEYDGLTVQEVTIEVFDEAGRPATLDPGLRDNLYADLNVQVGEPFRHEDTSRDLKQLLRVYSLIGGAEDRGVFCEVVPGGVRVLYRLVDSGAFERIEFRGLDHFKELQVRTLLGLNARQRLTGFASRNYELKLEELYRRDGYYHVHITRRPDRDDPAVLVFEVDEGPKVTIRSLAFRGNLSYPARSPLNLTPNLRGSAEVESVPGIFYGAPFSEEVVAEDLDRLRFFYRERGYKDAMVELAERRWHGDDEIDLVISIEEGRRYRIGSIELQQIPAEGDAPLYPADEILAKLDIEPGDDYSIRSIQRDEDKIEAFYGERGHIPRDRYGADVDDPVVVLPTKERYSIDEGLVHLKFVVVEGTPKRVRAVRIRGNTNTKDRVVRRNIFLMPGDVANLREAEASVRQLDSLGYFQDPETLRSVRLRFERPPPPPTGLPASDEVDAVFEVAEGDTGNFLWGVGVSTNAGLQGRFVLTKQNFDAFRFPSSANPATWIDEIRKSEAFHGAGQTLELLVAPGDQISQFRVGWTEPDIFRSHQNTVALRLEVSRLLRRGDGYLRDSTAFEAALTRSFTRHLSAQIAFREELAVIENVANNAPTIVVDAEGRNSIRSVDAQVRWQGLDFPPAPTSGYDLRAYIQYAGLGGDAEFYKTGVSAEYHLPLWVDERDRSHVLYSRWSFDYGEGIGSSRDLFITERFFIGGSTLRGFQQRQAGPFQFGRPTGGEARLLGRMEYRFPLFATRPDNAVRDLELLRGAFFADYGQLGLSLQDSTFDEPRLSVGFGLRFLVPSLNIPIALDFGWPLLSEDSDNERVFQFTLTGNR
jgi:outer membrane protein insertion porin family